ncbi:MAG: Na+/H+ antiporter NhaC family protein [Lentisphaeria bacterium]|nr:Na+/H+ antiporter NhaC family protein [Lentisphaeria bacterium]
MRFSGFDPGLKALFPFAVFVIFYLFLSIYAGDFYAIPMPVAFLAAAAAALFAGKGAELDEKVEIFVRGMGESNIMLMGLIFILAGAFAAVAKGSGAVESAVNIARHLIPGNLLAGGMFLVSCFISLAIGTSCGTIAALAPIAVALAEPAGTPPALMLGTVVGGAMFGDNMSMISDTTIAATRTQGVGMKEKFLVNMKIALPAAVLTLLIYLFAANSGGTPLPASPLGFRDFLRIFPYAAILVCALTGMNVVLLLFAGTLLALAIGVALGSFTLTAGLSLTGKGILGMAETLIVAVLAGGVLGVIRYNGGISYLMKKIERLIAGPRGCEAGCALLVTAVNLFTANNTVAIVIAGPVAKELSEKFRCSGRRIAAILDCASCVAQGIIPYGAQILIAAGIARSTGTAFGIPQLLGKLYYPYILGILLILFILRGATAGPARDKQGEEKNA